MTLNVHSFKKHLSRSLERFLTILLTFIVLMACCPSSVFAESKVINFVDAEGNPMQCDHYVEVYQEISAMSDGWYVVNKVITANERIVVTGKVDLILCDSSDLFANKGIYIKKGSSLTIWQEKPTNDHTGYLAVAIPDKNNAGIGGNEETVGGDLTINGGYLEINSGKYAAAIGGGSGEGSGYGSITINGGYVKADSFTHSNESGAAIGGGKSNNALGPVEINGGTVYATAGAYAAAIGGGEDRNNGRITINGGIVTAIGGRAGAGIGGGEGGSLGKGDSGVYISGGYVTAMALIDGDDYGGAGIGGGASTWGGGGDGGTVKIAGGTVIAKGYHAIGAGNDINAEEKLGTVDLYDEAAVSTSNSEDNNVASGNRAYTCLHSKEVWIKPCKHKDAMITATEDHHQILCEYCAVAEGGLQEHVPKITAEAVAPTCTEAGLTEASECEVCGLTLTIRKEVPALGHDLTHHGGKAATCTEAGNSEYWTCAACGKFYSDAKGKNEIAKDSWIIPATGHSWNDGEVSTQATTTSTGIMTYTCRACGQTREETIAKINASDALKEGASEAAAEQVITNLKNDNDPAGTIYGLLQLRSTSQTKTKVRLAWNKVAVANKYVIYGNACGAKNRMKKLGEVKGTVKTKAFTKIAGKKIRKGTYYKFIIVAVDKSGKVVSTSKIIHVATKGGKVGNHKSVTVANKVIAAAKSLKKGKSIKLNAKQVPQNSKRPVKKHRVMKYESSNPEIAKVTNKGTVKGLKKGTCYIYAYAQNGIAKKIKVTVK